MQVASVGLSRHTRTHTSHIFLPVVAHKAVAAVSKIGRMDGRAIPLLDRKVVCFLFFGNGCSGHLGHNCWM